MKLLAIDSNSILNRAFYGIKLLTTKDGQFTNAIYGFLNIFLKLLDETKPDVVAFAFDLRAPTFRHKRYDGYKANRKGMPPELAAQLEPLKEILTLLGYKIVEQEGFEADDILGTLAKGCSTRGDDCVIATGDRDSFQLIDEHTNVRLAFTKGATPQSELLDIAAIKEKYGLTPKQLIEVKALMGDASDNIPGVPGVGEKTALALIAEFGDLNGVYANLDSPSIKAGVRAKLEANRELADLSRELAEICCDAPVDTDPAHYEQGSRQDAALYQMFTKLEMNSMINRFSITPGAFTPTATEDAAQPVNSPLQRADNPPKDAFWKAIEGQETLYLLPQFQVTGGKQVKTLSLELSIGDTVYCLNEECDYLEEAMAYIAGLNCSKVTSGCKDLYKYGYIKNTIIQNVIFDLELAGYLLDPNLSSYEPERLAAMYQIAVPVLEGTNAQYLKPLYEGLSKELKENGQEKLLLEMEIPLAEVLASMECEGIYLDTEGLKEYGVELDGRLEEYCAQIYGYAGEEFNINSPKQLGSILFDKLGLPTRKKTKSGYSTDAAVLESLEGIHPIVDSILNYRQLAKLKSTYVDGLLKVVDDDQMVRSNFKQSETRTGRISSTEPNMQNIPVRTAEGSRLRRFFTARPGLRLVDADYSQIELRVLADIANDENMIAAFQADEDIHTNTAAQVFHMPKDFVTPQMRSASKAVNFGIVYGISAFSLSKNIGVTVAEAKQYIESYLNIYHGVKKYMDSTVATAKENGYVTTLFGRRRYLPELKSSNKNLRSFGERVAMNMPIQGTAADIIKIAMIKVYRRLQKEGLKAKLILQVHDELIVEAPAEEVTKVKEILTQEMANAVQMKVHLDVEAKDGESWYDAK